MKPKALIVEDDDRIIGSIEDTLFSIGHEHDWATNQHDAQQMLKDSDYSYVLLDLQIPAKPNRGGANKEFGCNLLRDIQRIKGRGRTPVIVMTAYIAECVNLATELHANGASEFITKPFDHMGRTLESVIRKVLENHRGSIPEPAASDPDAELPGERPFAGGELTFFPDRAELCGVKIITDMGAGQSLMLLHQLRRQDRQGRFVRLSGEDLAKSIDAPGGVGTVTGCVRAIRRNMVARLAKHCHILCRSDDLIRSDEQGYYLREWITVRDAVDSPQKRVVAGDKSEATFAAAGNDVTCAPHATGSKPTADEGSQLNERQQWLLAELRTSTAMRRSDFERQFNIHARTAKRDLADLNQRGLIEFVGDGREGFYRLRRAAAV